MSRLCLDERVRPSRRAHLRRAYLSRHWRLADACGSQQCLYGIAVEFLPRSLAQLRLWWFAKLLRDEIDYERRTDSSCEACCITGALLEIRPMDRAPQERGDSPPSHKHTSCLLAHNHQRQQRRAVYRSGDSFPPLIDEQVHVRREPARGEPPHAVPPPRFRLSSRVPRVEPAQLGADGVRLQQGVCARGRRPAEEVQQAPVRRERRGQRWRQRLVPRAKHPAPPGRGLRPSCSYTRRPRRSTTTEKR